MREKHKESKEFASFKKKKEKRKRNLHECLWFRSDDFFFWVKKGWSDELIGERERELFVSKMCLQIKPNIRL